MFRTKSERRTLQNDHKEWSFARVVRFCAVGASVAAVYLAVYLSLVRSGANEALANVLAYAIAIIIQYVAHALWTFKGQAFVPRQILRFCTAVGLGLIVSTLITSAVGPGLAWQDWQSAILVVILLPVFNFMIFSLWVFRGKQRSGRRNDT